MLGALLYPFVIVAVVIGGLELFDRTTFAMIAIAARSRPGPTWGGGAAAFVATTAIAVTAGAALVAALGPSHLIWFRLGGGAFLIVYAGWLYVRPAEEDEEPGEREFVSAFAAAFLTIFLLELGDTTMIFEIVFVADYGWLVVLVGGAAALVTVAAWNVFLGRQLAHRLTPRRLRAITTVVMAVVGVVTILYGLVPALFAF